MLFQEDRLERYLSHLFLDFFVLSGASFGVALLSSHHAKMQNVPHKLPDTCPNGNVLMTAMKITPPKTLSQ